MNKIFKVIWNEARNAYVVVSEIAKNHGSKSCSTKKLLAMLIATGVMTCASFDVLAAQPAAKGTAAQQYVALKAADFPATGPRWFNKDTWGGLGSYEEAKAEWDAQKNREKQIGNYTYALDKNKYWVRKGYVLTVDENGGKYTQLSDNAIRADVAYTGTGVPEGILQSVTSTVARNGVVTHSGDSLQKVTAGSYAGVSNSGGTEVAGSWNYIINDSSWENSGAEYKDGYVDLVDLKGDKMPRGFKTTDSGLNWDEVKQTYTYQGKAVDYRNMYVIDGKLGVFTNADGSEVYTGTVYGKHNEILMTVKDNGKFYSYWAASVTDPSVTMETYPVSKYNSDLAVIDKNIKDLNKDIIKEVTLTKDTNSAIIGLVRNGGKAVDGAITVTSGGGTDGSGADNDTFVKISNAADTEGKTFATGSKVEAIVDNNGATTGIKINGEDYTIKSGSKVSVTQTADKKTTTITVDGTETTITDTDTTYTEGDGIEISDANAISVSKNLTGMQSIKGAGGTINLAGSAITVNKTTFNKDGRIQNVANGTETKDAVNFGQLQETNNKVDNLTTEVGKGWTVATENGTATKVGAGDTVKFIGDDNIVVSNTGKNVVVKLGKELTGLTSVTTNNAYVTKVDASKNESVTNVEYVKNQIADAALSAGKGISITDKKINVKLKDGEENLKVDETGLYLRKDLTGMESITGVGDGKISFATGGNVTINKITFNKDGRIQNVENGTETKDAVNFGQLQETNNKVENLKVEAGKHTTLVNGENTTVEQVGDGKDGKQYKVNVDLSQYAKTEDVAVVYVDNNKNKSLHTTNSGAVESNAIALGKGASAHENSVVIGDGAYTQKGNFLTGSGYSVALGNNAVTGTKSTSVGYKAIGGRVGTITVGYNSYNGAAYGTVIGTESKINYSAQKTANAAATIVGAQSEIIADNKPYSGVANGIFGSANKIQNSNGVTIQGSGNTVTNAYKDMSGSGFNLGGVSVKKDAGAVGVIGGMNTVSNQIYTNVIGFGNTVAGDADNISHDVFLAGSRNNLSNVSDSIVMGNENAITGVSNVISFGHDNKIKASNAVAIGNGAGVSVEGGVALGVGSVASTAANALGYGAAEGETGIAWKATNGAVSVGSSVEGKKITRQITNVAAGTEDTDAVNVAQLKKVSEAAASASQGWKLKTQNGNASDVKPGDEVEFDGDANIQVGNDGNKVSVTLKKQLTGIQSITGAGEGAGSISFANGGKVKVNDVIIEKGGKITGVADGKISADSKEAVNGSQLNAVKETANKGWNLSTNGDEASTKVAPGETVDFSGDKNISVSHDGTNVKVELNDELKDIKSISNGNKTISLDGTALLLKNGDATLAIAKGAAGMQNGAGASVVLNGTQTVINGGVTFDHTGKITNVKAGEADTDAVNVSQLNAVKETANKGWNLSTNGGEASKVAPDATVDFSGDKNISVSHDGTKVQVELNKNIDVNYVQTNALNAKYNLSVGTANENGTVPFLVNSTGAFYAANNNFSVDKYGKVIATAGEIGNVVLKNGVYTGNSALRDGELYLGDASGNYSQITTTGAKLGQVTIAADGKISGVAAGEVSKTSTDAINGSQLNQTNENVAALDKRVTQNEADIAQNKADIAQNKADIAQNKADIAQNKADIATNKQNIDKLNTRVDGVEKLAKQHTTVTAGDNIAVTETTNKDGGKEYNVALKNIIDLGDKGSVTTGQTEMNKDGLKVGDKVSVTATAVTAGKTSISDEGVKVGDKTYISADGLNANGQHITNVKAGEADTDAVNYGQLKDTNNRIDGVENQVISNSNRINQLGNRVNKVGAGAAALAALHPMDFDPDDKLTFSAGYGNYGGENAAAIGAYYRPDEKVMFSVAGTVGNGENMVNAGVSFALDRTNHVSNSRTALAREVIDLRGQLAVMGAKMAKMEKAFGMLDETKTKLFPDVPANHWAYEYIAKLAGNGYIEGYPDGNFGGDRLMTRYEFAAMLYRAIEKGAALEEKIIKEFEPELGRIRVDRISGEDGDRDKIERVRVNDTKGERDHYGNKLAK